MVRSSLFAAVFLFVGWAGGSAKADMIVAYWSMNNDPFTMSIAADLGAGTLTFGNLVASGISSPSGDLTNAQPTFAAGQALAVRGVADLDNNGRYFEFSTSFAGLRNAEVSWAQSGTATGFSSRAFSFSINGSDFTEVGTDTGALSASWETESYDLSSFTALNNASTAWFRVTLDNATNAAGNNRFDNLTIRATAVPEPTSLVLVGLAAGGGLGVWRRKKRLEA